MVPQEPVSDRRLANGWVAHLVGVGLGLLFFLALAGHARLATSLAEIRGRGFVSWPILVEFGLLFLWGIVVVVVIWFAARLPALPTTVALVLLYGAGASLPTPFAGRLPMLGPWQPRLFSVVGGDYRWPGSAMTVMAGAIAAAAVRGWWAYARKSGDSQIDGSGRDVL